MFTLFTSLIRARLTALLMALSLVPTAASAAVLMLDFGPTVATGASLSNSPYHTVNSSFTDTSWNTIGLANVSSGLVYSNGSAATGVTLTLGSSKGSTLLNFSQLPGSSSALGATINTGVFADTSVGKDGIFTSAPAGNNLVGVKIGGLSAGQYEIYVVGLNTSNGPGYQSPSVFFAAATGNVGTFETNGLTPSASTLLASQVNWVEGDNYAKVTITLNAGQSLVLVADGTGSEDRGFLNAMQIVAVPEPQTMLLCLIGLIALPLLRRSGKRQQS